MARFTAQINVGEQNNVTYKMAATITDNDVLKPVTYPSTTDLVVLAANGEQIYGFITAVMPGLQDGKKIVSIQIDGRMKVILDGASAVGTIVEAAANEAAGVAKAGNYGLVSTHTLVAATRKQWMIISGAGDSGTVALIEKL